MSRFLTLGLLAWLIGGGALRAQSIAATAPDTAYSYEQRLGEPVPLDLEFQDEAGRAVHMRDFFAERPVILVLVQYRCPNLCNQVLNGLVDCLRDVPADMGNGYEVVTVSFDEREAGLTVADPALGTVSLARAKKQAYVEDYGRPGAAGHWHFLTGGPESIRRLTSTVGFQFAYAEEAREGVKERRYAHPSGVVVLTPEGRVSRYFYGIRYDAQDMGQVLDAARSNKVGRMLKGYERVLLLCYDYDERGGTLKANVLKIMRTVAALSVLGLGCYLLVSWCRGPRRPAEGARPEQEPGANAPPLAGVGESGPRTRGE